MRRIDALECQKSANSTSIAVRSWSRVHSHRALFPTHPVLDPTQGHQVGFQGLQKTGKVPRKLGDPQSNTDQQGHNNSHSLPQTPCSVKTHMAKPLWPVWMLCVVIPLYPKQFHRSCPLTRVKPGLMQLKVRSHLHNAQADITPLILSQCLQN